MTDARTAVLGRIREALSASAPSSAPSPTSADEPSAPRTGRPGPNRTSSTSSGDETRVAAIPRAYRESGEFAAGSPEALELLVDRLVDYKAAVHRVSPEEVSSVVARLVAAGPEPDGVADTPVTGGDDGTASRHVVVPRGLDPRWLSDLPDGVRTVRDDVDRPLTASDLDRTDAVVTAARVAVAETGTIVLDGAADQGRRALSLVPDVHLCVVRARQVVHTVPEAVRLLAEHPARPLTWISGPSATSDIELNRVEGVHGPRTLHVILVL